MFGRILALAGFDFRKGKMNNHTIFMTFADLSNVAKDSYPIRFSQMKEDKVETWFLPPGYRIYQDSSDPHNYYRFSSHLTHNVSNNLPHSGCDLFKTIKNAHKHYQEKNLIEMLNKNAKIGY